MKLHLRILFLMFMTASGPLAMGQTIPFFGKVVTQDASPIPLANVLALDPETQTIASFGVTDEEGKFKLNLRESKPYLLRISSLGYETMEREILAESNAASPMEAVLASKAYELDTAEVVYELPVTVSGDTITYKADAFASGRERKLGEILGKLPGFEVDENGEVSVQGQKVSKLMVEGKDFFDGDTKMGAANIPANAVDKVQLLKDFNEITPIRGLDNDETLALNITLKEGKQNMVFGDLTAGAGPESRYLAHANAFYYTPKFSINLIGDANNVGEPAFTIQDYFRFSGGLGALGSQSGGRVSFSPDDAGIPMAQRNNAVELQTNLGALNFNYKPSSKWSHSGFLIGSQTDNRMASISQRTYIRAGDNEEELTADNQVAQQSGILKYAATYTPKEETYIKYSLFGKLVQVHNRTSQWSRFENFDNQISEDTRQRPYTLEQQLQAFFTPLEKHVFSLETGLQLKMQDPILELQATERPFGSILPLADRELYHVWQSVAVQTYKQETLFNYYYLLNPRNHLNLTLGSQWTGQEMISGILQRNPGEEDLDPGEAFANDISYTFQDHFAGVSYKTRINAFVFSPGMNFHHFRLRDQQEDTENLTEKNMLLPHFYARWQPRSSQSLTFQFKTEAEFVDVQQLAMAPVIKDYNSLFLGNRNLQNGLYERYNLSYNQHNLFSAFTVFSSLSYQRKRDDLAPSVNFIGLDRVNTLIHAEQVNESLSGSFQGDKRFDKWRAKGRANISAASTHNFVNDQPNLNQSFTQLYGVSLMTTFFKKLDLETGYEWMRNAYSSGQVANSFETNKPFAKIHYAFRPDWMLTGDYEYNRYLNKGTGTDSRFGLLNLGLTYGKKDSPWEFKASLYNALNTQSISRDSFNESLISTYAYFIQKRYLLLSVQYNL